MTENQIKTTIIKTQKQVNTLLSMANLDGEVSINIEIKEKEYNSFATIQNRIEDEVIIERSNLKIGLFFKWIK